MIERTCQTCGEKYKTFPSAKKKFCNNKCYTKLGIGNPKWRGGFFLLDGYKYIYSPDHPDRTNNGYVAEHRLIMEKMIGRRLTKKEAVHHLNHNRVDNRPNNLHLCTSNGSHFIENHLVERTKNGRFKKAIRSI